MPRRSARCSGGATRSGSSSTWPTAWRGARGGGSLEDLWPFNEEVVARAIVGSRLPVVSAIVHEVDPTIADLAADRRALTPSEAGEITVPDAREVRQSRDRLADRIAQAGR